MLLSCNSKHETWVLRLENQDLILHLVETQMILRHENRVFRSIELILSTYFRVLLYFETSWLDLLCVDVLKHTNGNPAWVSKCTSCISLTFVQSGRQYNPVFRALKAKYATMDFFSGYELGMTTLVIVSWATWLIC